MWIALVVIVNSGWLKTDMGGKSSKKLSKEDMDFLIDNTNFTKEQIKAWYKGFMVSTAVICKHKFCVVILKKLIIKCDL